MLVRILLQADMDGAAMIADHRELVPIWPSYWRLGRDKMNREVAAAAQGLLDGGATEVVVFDGHGSGVQNLDDERMPEKTSIVPLAEIDRLRAMTREGAFDAAFQVGRHPRTGTNDGFMPHTQMLGLALAVDGMPVTECHLLAWSAGVPVLGIAGDARLQPQLDGILGGTPFLAVKHSTGRGTTAPAFATGEAAAEAVRAFARSCVMMRRAWRAPALPETFTFSACIFDPQVAATADGVGGLVRQSERVLSATCHSWLSDAVPAMYAAMQAVGDAQRNAVGTVSVSSEADIASAGAALTRARAQLDDWIASEEPFWLE